MSGNRTFTDGEAQDGESLLTLPRVTYRIRRHVVLVSRGDYAGISISCFRGGGSCAVSTLALQFRAGDGGVALLRSSPPPQGNVGSRGRAGRCGLISVAQRVRLCVLGRSAGYVGLVPGYGTARRMARSQHDRVKRWRRIAGRVGFFLPYQQLRSVGGVEHVPEDLLRFDDVLRCCAAVLP